MSSGGSSIDRAFHREAEGIAEGGAIFGVESDPQQLDMLREADGHLPDNIFQLARAGQGAKRGPGRPAGSLNRRSADLAKLIVQQHGDPVMSMASLYSMPLDQLVETVLIADGTIARQRKLDENLALLTEEVAVLARRRRVAGEDSDISIDRLADACEALEGVARRSQGKPGDVAIKALNVKLAAAKAVAEYVHSKKPVEAIVRHQADAVLVMPSAQASSFEALDDGTRQAAQIIGMALASGEITAESLVGLTLRDGQLVDGEYEDVPEESC